MKKMNVMDWITCILVIIGALNWGLIGFINLNLISLIFGDMSVLSRIIYALIGLSGIWMIFTASKCCKS